MPLCICRHIFSETRRSHRTKHLRIVIGVVSLKLAKIDRDIGEAREEDAHNGDWGGWDWAVGRRKTVVVLYVAIVRINRCICAARQ